MNQIRNAAPYTRTQRRHLETVEEVKEIARDRLMQDGVSGMSLRAIARDMGVVPSALYRYFPSHAHLVDSLADDAAASMLDHVEQAVAGAPEGDYCAQWIAGLRAYRSWALDHPPGYSLNFGDLSGERFGSGPSDVTVRRLIEVLTTIVMAALADGSLEDRSGSDIGRAIFAVLPPKHLEEQAAVATLSAWSAIHGAVALEVSGRLPDLGISADDHFEAQLLGVSRAIGFKVD